MTPASSHANDLASVQAQRAAVASSFRSPRWYFPATALCVFAVLAGHDLAGDLAAGLVSIAGLVGMGVAVWAAERGAPFTPHWRSAGRKAGAITGALFLIVLAIVALASVASSRSDFPLTWSVAGAVSGMIIWAAGRSYDAAVRADLQR